MFVYLEENNKEHEPLIQAIKEDLARLYFLEYKGEYIWPAFLLCEQDETISSQLVGCIEVNDSISEFNYSFERRTSSSEEGILIHLFGTSIFTRKVYSELIPFESIITSSILPKLKKENFILRFVRYSFYYFRILAEKEQRITPSNAKQAIHHLVYIEETATNSKSFAILMNM